MTDIQGVTRPCLMFAARVETDVSSAQLNFMIAAGTATGPAMLTARRASGGSHSITNRFDRPPEPTTRKAFCFHAIQSPTRSSKRPQNCGIQAYGREEFVKRLANFDPYLAALRKDYEESKIDQYFVPLRIREEKEGAFSRRGTSSSSIRNSTPSVCASVCRCSSARMSISRATNWRSGCERGSKASRCGTKS